MQRFSCFQKGVVAAASTLCLSCTTLSPAAAQTLDYNQAPVSNVVSALRDKYGINIVLRGNFSPSQRVTLSADGTGTPVQRLQVVNSLANALGGDFQKVYVISRAPSGATPPPVKVDTNAEVIFPATRLSLSQAIQTLANADSALVQMDNSLSGTVTLSDSTLPAAQAAAEIARQTQTRWKVFYAVYPRGQSLRLGSGQVVDRTNGGQPIIKLPYQANESRVRQRIADQQARDAQTQQQDQDPVTSGQQQANAAADNSQNTGYDPYAGMYGNSGYGSLPYGYGSYGFDPYNYGVSGVYGPGFAATTNDPYATIQSGPGGGFNFGGAYNNPYSGVTVLPNFPYFGGYGGPVVIGGYGGPVVTNGF